MRRWFAIAAGLLCLVIAVSYAAQEEIHVICQKSFYSPDTIHLKKGQPARIVLESRDVTHGFAVDEFNVAREVSPGNPTVVEFTPDRTGQFTFYCVVRCGTKHRTMHGTLIVE